MDFTYNLGVRVRWFVNWLYAYVYGAGFVDLGRKQDCLSFLNEGLTPSELNHHVHVVGASGYGKSVLLSHLVRSTIRNGRGLFYIDLKSDIETVKEVQRLSYEANRLSDLRILSISDPKISDSYNLLKRGTPTQLRDRIMMSLNWSEEYYKSVTSSFLLKVMLGLCWLSENRSRELTLKDVLDVSSDPEVIRELALMIPGTEIAVRVPMEEARTFLSSKDGFNSLQSLRSQLENILLSDFGKLVSTVGVSTIDLFGAVQSGHIVYILLDSRSYGETAKSLARFILQDLKATSAKIDSEIPKAQRKPFQVVIDEFADMATEDFVSFLDRARSSRMSVVLAHQELADLKRVSPEFAARLMGNMSTLYAFLQKNKESAELISSSAGTREVRKETVAEEGFWFFRRPTGGRSVRMVEEFNIHPNVIKSLKVGECVAVKKYPYARAYRVKIHKPRETALFTP